MKLLVKNGTVVSSRGERKEDVFVEGGIVRAVAPALDVWADEVVDAEGCLVLPGGIDPHTHMELRQMGTVSSDTFLSGSLAALCGGTTTLIDFANQVRGETLRHTIERSLAQAQGKTHCDYGFHVAVTDASEACLAEIPTLVSEYGVTSFKTFLAYDALMLTEQEFRRVLRAVKLAKGLVTLHAEVGSIIRTNIADALARGNVHPRFHRIAHSVEAEAEATRLAAQWAREEDCPLYVVHVTNAAALGHIVAAKKLGQRIYAETCPQYLMLDEELYEKDFDEAKKYVMSPPLRSALDRQALWHGVANADVDTVGTDHCPFLLAQKDAGRFDFSKIPNGAPGVEERMALLYSEGVAKGLMTLAQFREVTSTRAAALFGLAPWKGDIAVGGHGDIVVFDPHRTWRIEAAKHHMNVDYSCYEGLEVVGKTRDVVLQGKIVVRNGEPCGLAPGGLYLKRRLFS
jgi:dihydropyrimidinase